MTTTLGEIQILSELNNFKSLTQCYKGEEDLENHLLQLFMIYEKELEVKRLKGKYLLKVIQS